MSNLREFLTGPAAPVIRPVPASCCPCSRRAGGRRRQVHARTRSTSQTKHCPGRRSARSPPPTLGLAASGPGRGDPVGSLTGGVAAGASETLSRGFMHSCPHNFLPLTAAGSVFSKILQCPDP